MGSLRELRQAKRIAAWLVSTKGQGVRTVRCCATQSSQRNMSSPSSRFLSTGPSANKWNRGISRRSKKKIHGHNNAVPATFDVLTVSERKLSRDLGFGRGRDLGLAAGERERERDFLLA